MQEISSPVAPRKIIAAPRVGLPVPRLGTVAPRPGPFTISAYAQLVRGMTHIIVQLRLAMCFQYVKISFEPA